MKKYPGKGFSLVECALALVMGDLVGAIETQVRVLHPGHLGLLHGDIHSAVGGLKGEVDSTITLAAHAKAHGWDAGFGAGDQSISIGQSGRGERI